MNREWNKLLHLFLIVQLISVQRLKTRDKTNIIIRCKQLEIWLDVWKLSVGPTDETVACVEQLILVFSV